MPRVPVVAFWLLLFSKSVWPQNAVAQPAMWEQANNAQRDILTVQASGTKASLRGLAAVSADVAWCSGTEGTVLRTIDGGERWQDVSVPGCAAFDFRDMHAFNDRVALVICAGSPGRIYRTRDGGQSWTLRYQNEEPEIFFDALSFWNEQRGLAFSDPQQGRFLLLETEDGGLSWSPLPESLLPVARQGEAGFAASGTCLAVAPSGRTWIGLGGKVEPPCTARILCSLDYGRSWTAVHSPLPASSSSGIFSLAIIGRDRGVAVGGDYLQPHATGGNAAITSDAGASWRKPRGSGPRGYRSAVACVQRGDFTILIAAGPSGMDYSSDFGDNWLPLHDTSLHALAFSSDGRGGWGSGPQGTIVRFNLDRWEALIRSP